ncbi:MAG: PHP domain-containing protein [Chloroflexi bacterium]|nr:PHP domain-containing protein [Chloroflexota bacterium]
MLKCDLHSHTAYSLDCTQSLEEVIEACLKKGINCLAVTDHGNITGALKMKAIAPFKVIVSEEILTSEGEIIGFFLQEGIPNSLSPEETVQRIKAQGGLVCIPHPFDRFRISALRPAALQRIASDIDVLEAFNSRTPLYRDSDRASVYAHRNGLPVSAGGDAHTTQEVGNAYIEMPDFSGPDEFLQALRLGKLHGERSSFAVHIASTWFRLVTKMTRGIRIVWHWLVLHRAG